MAHKCTDDRVAERARELLSYDPETGGFHWKVARGRAPAGSLAGSEIPQGYRVIGIDGRLHFAHRLAWLITHRRWPVEHIDHINGVRSDNRLCNLREASCAENLQNQQHPARTSKTGVLGVSPCRGEKYLAQIRINGKQHRLGAFETIAEAAEVYRQAKREAHPFWHEAPMPKAEHSHL